MKMWRREFKAALGAVALLWFFVVFHKQQSCPPESEPIIAAQTTEVSYSHNQELSSDKDIVFIGGVPRSGTTLMRAMLDAHPDVRCGQETRVIPRILGMVEDWMSSEKERLRLEAAGVDREVLNSAIASFCLKIITRHIDDNTRKICDKDPFVFFHAAYLSEVFPRAKFILMVRDGRAVAHSIISRKVTIPSFNLTTYSSTLQSWNDAISYMYDQCQMLGSERCMMVYYEQLVLKPAHWMRQILYYLDIPWNDSVLHHEDFINKPNGVLLSKFEKSTNQVVNPINVDALTKWVGQIPHDVKQDMLMLAPMLAELGYDPSANPPNYSLLDDADAPGLPVGGNSAHGIEPPVTVMT